MERIQIAGLDIWTSLTYCRQDHRFQWARDALDDIFVRRIASNSQARYQGTRHLPAGRHVAEALCGGMALVALDQPVLH